MKIRYNFIKHYNFFTMDYKIVDAELVNIRTVLDEEIEFYIHKNSDGLFEATIEGFPINITGLTKEDAIKKCKLFPHSKEAINYHLNLLKEEIYLKRR